MPSTALDPSARLPARALRAVQPDEQRASATQFSECVRAVVTLCRRRGLRPPVFRSPPRIAGVDRSIQRRANGTVVVAVRRGERPLAAVRADVIEGAIVANGLSGESADRFRGMAWAAIDGGGPSTRARATMEPVSPARVA